MTVNFRLPGPTPLPPEVLEALTQEMIPHRGPAFRELFRETLERAKRAHRTDGDVLIWAASGSAGWEVAIVNLLSPGDPLLTIVNGDFGDRFSRVASRLGIDVRRVDVSWGAPVLPGQLRDALDSHPDVRAVALVHNETSTGVTNPLRDLAAVVRDHGALLLVDSVSGVGALPLEVDAWGIDFVMSGSQKAWMCPPGLLIVAAGPRAWEAHQRSKFPRFYWDMTAARKMAEEGMTPTTPPLSLIYAYRAALEMIEAEGLENVWERHHRLAELTREGIRDAGLELFAMSGFESDSVTAFIPPDGVPARDMLAALRQEHKVEAQGGQAHLADSLIRIGHMGWVHEPEMRQAIAAITAVSARLGAEKSNSISVSAHQAQPAPA
jgi:aspartate aminotransferase-like enzyme